jgi:hypothetical protein
MLNNLLSFFKTVLIATVSQLFWLLGLIFIFGFILYFFSRFTRNVYSKTSGTTLDIFITGWIGTPIHELGHALFCIIFRHKIEGIKLYSPNSNDGTLGYVNHSYDQNSIYQKIGNFFIGIGPILLGAATIYGLLHFLTPNIKEVSTEMEAQSKIISKGLHGELAGILNSLWQTTRNILTALFQKGNWGSYKFWIFLYLSLCISSHMELSPPDIKGAWKGLVSIVIAILVINIIIIGCESIGFNTYLGNWWQLIKLENYATNINKGIGILGSIFILSTIVSCLFFFITYFVFNFYNLLKGKGAINPFWS